MQDMIKTYTADLPKLTPSSSHRHSRDEIVVLMTGSTGNVGSQVLATLLADKRITKVYALNRPSTVSYNRQQAAFLDRGLDAWLLEDTKFTELVGDISKEYFGLTPTIFNTVCLQLAI